jgi:cobalt transporter, putative
MFNQQKLIGYHAGKTFLHGLSGASKLIFFILVSVAAMMSYDTRFLLLVALASLMLFRVSEIRLKDISFVLAFAGTFATLNILMVYLFAPQYGVEIYGAKNLIWTGWGAYSLTLQELFYLLNLLLKYFSTIPLAVIFLMTTHPSQFASSLNQIGLSYKIAYAVSLTLRYIPDLQEEFYLIKMSQEARGQELSKKAPLSKRVKGNLQIVIPLIFSSLERINTIATAMELRRFGKNKKRTWYTQQAFGKLDKLVILVSVLLLALSLLLFVVNQGRFYNPWA